MLDSMCHPIIRVEDVSKRYRLGQFDARTMGEEVKQLFRRFRKKVSGVGDARAPCDNPELWALKNVSFSVQPGEVVGIIGRNGAGKSTLLKILSRITEPTDGEIRIRGRVASLLEVGTGFHPNLTGRENIFLNGTILGMTKAEVKAKFDEIVAFADIDKFLDTPVKRYSSGMHVRLAFAVAAHLDPDILLVDEVLAVGDAEFQRKCIGKMQDVTVAGRTILFVSHNMRAIQSLCRRAILFERGCLTCDSSSHEVVTKYLGRGAPSSVATFENQAKGPCITKTVVDEAELLQGNLVIDIEFESPYALTPPIPALVLHDEHGSAVFSSNPKIHGEDFKARTLSEGRVHFEARDVPLVEGRYFLSFWLGDWHYNYDQKMDVLSVDFRPRRLSGRIPDTVGLLDWPASWKLQE